MLRRWTTHCRLAATYVWFWMLDQIDCYHTYLILSLPPYMFGPPVYTVKQQPEQESTDSDDSDSECQLDKSVEYLVFISHLVCTFMQDNQSCSRILSGSQLRPLVDEKGRFFIGKLVQFFPTLDTIMMKYVKTPISDPCSKGSAKSYWKLIDVKRRRDVHNDESCMMGVIF